MIFRARAPMRIDLAGGWTDVAPYAGSHGYPPHFEAGLPRFAGARFQGEYPLARVIST